MQEQNTKPITSKLTKPFLNEHYSLQNRSQFRSTNLFQKAADALSQDLEWLKKTDAVTALIATHSPRSRANWERTYFTSIQPWNSFQREAQSFIPMLRFLGTELSERDAVTVLCILFIDIPYELHQKDAASPFAGTPFSQAARAAFRRTDTFNQMNPAWNASKQNHQSVLTDYGTLLKVFAPTSLSEWERLYLDKGRSAKYLERVADRFRDFTSIEEKFYDDITMKWSRSTRKASIEEAKLAMFIHIFEETFSGFAYEKDALQLLRTWQRQEEVYATLIADAVRKGDGELVTFLVDARTGGVNIVFASVDIETDRNFAIDLEGFVGDRLVIAVQTKGFSYEKSSVHSENGKHWDGEKMSDYRLSNVGVPIYFLFSKDIQDYTVRLVPAEKVAYFPNAHTCMGVSPKYCNRPHIPYKKMFD